VGKVSKYIDIYNKLCPDDPIAKDDPRRRDIINEIRSIARAKNVQEATLSIEWWGWAKKNAARDFVIAARREARKR